MSLTVTTAPTFPASLYRPIQYKVQRSTDTFRDVAYIRPATALDVSGLGGGLVEGDILVEHTTYASLQVGQKMMLRGCGDYTGYRSVLKVIDDAHTVLDGISEGDYTGGDDSLIRLFLDKHTLYVDIRHQEENEDGIIGTMNVQIDVDGYATFAVNTVISSWFRDKASRLHEVVTGDTSDGWISTELLASCTFYISFREGYDVPTDGINVFTIAEIEADDLFGVAVNGVHPYDHRDDGHAIEMDWSEENFSRFRLNPVQVAKFLTYAPRRGRSIAFRDKSRLVVLAAQSGIDAGDEDYRIVVVGYDYEGGATELGVLAISPSLGQSSFAIPCGPRELSLIVDMEEAIDGFYAYGVFLLHGTSGLDVATEEHRFINDDRCKEVRRHFHWHNKLGGVDDFTFQRREVGTSNVKRTLVSKPCAALSAGVFDYRSRVHRADPSRSYSVTSEAIGPEMRKWLAEDLFESANILTSRGANNLTVVIPTDAAMSIGSTERRKGTATMTYAIGADNLSQEG